MEFIININIGFIQMIRRINLCIVLFFFVMCYPLIGKDLDRGNSHLREICLERWLEPEQSPSRYSFLQFKSNLIQNGESLYPFFEKIQNSILDGSDRICITHIGDSHLQTDYLTSLLRQKLQSAFGDAGRGLIFPYQAAGTNGPLDIRSASNADWNFQRTIYGNNRLPLGICGMAMQTDDNNFVLKIGTRTAPYRSDTIVQTFDRITLYFTSQKQLMPFAISASTDSAITQRMSQKKQTSCHSIKKGESLGSIARKYHCSVKELKKWNGLNSDRIRAGAKLKIVGYSKQSLPNYETDFIDYQRIETSIASRSFQKVVVDLDTPVDHFYLRGLQTKGDLIVHGIYLEKKNRSGVVYNMIGVNGAQLRHYLQADQFIDQLAELNSDLIIISLGTNDILETPFNKEEFIARLDTLISRIKALNPQCCLLLTTPPDIKKKVRSHSVRMELLARAICEYGAQQKIAVWDFFSIMGGSGSLQQWKKYRLAQSDLIHFTREGYELQGKLLEIALREAFSQYAR